MCWDCVVGDEGDTVILDDEMKTECNLIWDWYHAPDEKTDRYGTYTINNCGGALHVQLDDHNLEDHFLTDDWNLSSCYDKYPEVPIHNYSPETYALGQRIVEALRARSQAERQAIVYYADPYGPERPFNLERKK